MNSVKIRTQVTSSTSMMLNKNLDLITSVQIIVLRLNISKRETMIATGRKAGTYSESIMKMRKGKDQL